MSQNQMFERSNKPIDLAQLTCIWQVAPISSALVEVDIPKLIPLDGSGVDVAKLAQEANVDAGLLYRYMRYVSSVGVFKELPDRHFAHTESSKQLLPGHLTFYHLLFWASKYWIQGAAEYATQLKDPSKSAMEHAHKRPVWQLFSQSPQLEKHFADYMATYSNIIMPELLQHIKLPETGIVADVGGGYGHALLEFLKTNPNLTGIVYELPTVAHLVDEGLKSPNPPDDSIYSKYSDDVKKRVSVAAGSFMDNTELKQIADVDVFFFKWIFHGNTDTVCRQILAGLYQIMKPTAKIIICDIVYNHSPNEWKFPTTMDLNVAVTVSAKERTKDEWTLMLSRGDGYEYNISFGDGIIGARTVEMQLITLTKK